MIALALLTIGVLCAAFRKDDSGYWLIVAGTFLLFAPRPWGLI